MPRGSCLDSCMCYFKGVSSLTKRFNRLWWACWMSRALYQIQHSYYSLQSLTSTSFWCQMLRPTTPRPPLSRDSFIMANGRARTSLHCKQAREPTFQFASTWCHLIESEQEAWNAYPWILPPAAANRGISIKWSAHCDLESQLITTLFFFFSSDNNNNTAHVQGHSLTLWPCIWACSLGACMRCDRVCFCLCKCASQWTPEGITPVGLQLQQRPGCSDKRGSLYWDCDGLISLISFDGLLVQHSDSAG